MLGIFAAIFPWQAKLRTRVVRAGHPRATYREALAAVLDYRSWHAFELLLATPGEGMRG